MFRHLSQRIYSTVKIVNKPFLLTRSVFTPASFGPGFYPSIGHIYLRSPLAYRRIFYNSLHSLESSSFSSVLPMSIRSYSEDKRKLSIALHTEDKEDKEEKKEEKSSSKLGLAFKTAGLLAGSGLLFKIYEEKKAEIDERKIKKVQQISNLPARTPNYVRPSELWRQLTDALTFLHASEKIEIVAVTGVAGAGKSELVKAYLADSIAQVDLETKRRNLTTIIWLNADNGQVLEDDYFKLANSKFHIDIRESETGTKRDRQLIIQEFNRCLAQRPGWVLVFDNVEEKYLETIKTYLPSAEGQKMGKVILISRKQINIPAKFEIEVTGLPAKEATELLQNMAGKRDDLVTQQLLLNKIANLPFAIEQVGRLIKEKGLSFAEYLNQYTSLAPKPGNGKFYTDKDYLAIYQTAFGITLNALYAEEEIRPFLQIIAFLAPGKPVPTSFFRTSSERNTQELLNKLARYGLLKQGESNLWIHPAIPSLLRNKFNSYKDNREVCQAFERYISDDNRLRGNIAFNGLLVPHFDYFVQHVLNTDSAADIMLAARMRCAITSYYLQTGRPYVAKLYIEQAKLSLDKLVKPVGDSISNAAEICQQLVRLDTQKPSTYPTTYAHVHYFFGRLFAYVENDSIFTACEKWLDIAITMRKEIDAYKKAKGSVQIYDDHFNKDGMFTAIYERSGKALLLVIKAEHLLDKNKTDPHIKPALDAAEELLRKLLKFEEEQERKDYFHQSVCHDLLAKAILLKAKQDKVNRQELFVDALNESKKAIDLAAQNNQSRELAKFSCLRARIFLERAQGDDLTQAEDIFNKVRNTYKENDFPLAEAHEGLAYICRAKNALKAASKHIKESVEIQKAMGRIDSHPILQKTKALQQLIEMELAFRQQRTMVTMSLSIR